jgi:hypothetical protein
LDKFFPRREFQSVKKSFCFHFNCRRLGKESGHFARTKLFCQTNCKIWVAIVKPRIILTDASTKGEKILNYGTTGGLVALVSGVNVGAANIREKKTSRPKISRASQHATYPEGQRPWSQSVVRQEPSSKDGIHTDHRLASVLRECAVYGW